jgi:hypothetical protein
LTSRSLVQVTVVATRPQSVPSTSAVSAHRSGNAQVITKRDQHVGPRDALTMETLAYGDSMSTVTVTHVSTVHMHSREMDDDVGAWAIGARDVACNVTCGMTDTVSQGA